VIIVLPEGSEFLRVAIIKSIFWYKYRTVCSKSTDVSEEHAISMFMIEEWTKQGGNMKQVASRAGLFLGSFRFWRRILPVKRRLNFRGLHGDISRKTEQLRALTCPAATAEPTLVTAPLKACTRIAPLCFVLTPAYSWKARNKFQSLGYDVIWCKFGWWEIVETGLGYLPIERFCTSWTELLDSATFVSCRNISLVLLLLLLLLLRYS
jgi:hypothetical protein